MDICGHNSSPNHKISCIDKIQDKNSGKLNIIEYLHITLSNFPISFHRLISSEMATCSNYQNHLYSSDPLRNPSPMSVHLYLLLLLVLLPIGLASYLDYTSVVESMMDQLRLVRVVVIVMSPFILLLAIHWFSDSKFNARRWWIPFLVPLPERESLHRAGGSPCGLVLLVVLLVFLISNQSYFRINWFPILNR